MPVSPLAKDNVKENGHTSKNRKHFNENDETTAEESDMTNKDEDSDENNPAEPVITLTTAFVRNGQSCQIVGR